MSVPAESAERARPGGAWVPEAASAVLLGVFLACTLLFVVLPLPPAARTLAGHVVLIILPAAAAWCLLRAAAQVPQRQANSWMVFALGCGLAALGQLVLMLRTVWLGLPERFPSASFIFFLSFHPLFVAGVVLALQPRRARGPALEAVLDALLVLLTVGLAIVRLVIMPLREARPWLDPFLWITFGQLLMSVASLLFAVLLVTWREPTLPPRSVGSLIAAMTVNAVTNLLVASGFDPDPVHPGHAFSLLWVSGWLLIAWAGLEGARATPARTQRLWRRQVPRFLRRFSVPAVLVLLGGVAAGLLATTKRMPEARVVLVLLTATLATRWFVALRATERGGEQQRALAHTRALVELSGALSTVVELKHALELVASWAERLLHARGAAIEVTSEDHSTVLSAVGTLAYARGRTRPQRASFVPWVRTGAGGPRVAESAGNVPAALDLGLSPEVALAAAPLRFGGRVSGTLVLALDGRLPDATELELLGALGEQAAIAVENRRLEEEGREARQRRFQSEKLAMIGQLAGGVAHEINNPLAAIHSAAELLLENPGVQGEKLRLLTLVRAEARRASVIVRNLLGLVRPQAVCMEHVDLAEVIEDTLRLRAYAHGLSNITVAREIGPLAPVRADRNRLRQAFLNLLVNAEQAVAGQGIRRLYLQARTVAGEVEVQVADNGPGIPPEQLDKLFEPFFTTRPAGEGSGLGLAVTYGIVRELGGSIHAGNAPQGGAVFTIRLPAQQAQEELATSALEAPPTGMRELAGATVLLIDDESAIREVTARALRRAGFAVELADSGEAALELLQRRRFDAILTDLTMPGMGGAGLYTRLQKLGVPVLDRFLFMSGDTVAETTRRFVESTGQPCLSKPFELQALLAAVRRLAGAPA